MNFLLLHLLFYKSVKLLLFSCTLLFCLILGLGFSFSCLTCSPQLVYLLSPLLLFSLLPLLHLLIVVVLRLRSICCCCRLTYLLTSYWWLVRTISWTLVTVQVICCVCVSCILLLHRILYCLESRQILVGYWLSGLWQIRLELRLWLLLCLRTTTWGLLY